MKFLTILALLVLAACTTPAQQPDITPETKVDTETLHQWLHSGDPRLIAWSADFARRNHNGAILAEMPDLLRNWPAPANSFQARYQSQMAGAAVLDALIQENSQLQVDALRAIALQFPGQAAIFASRLSPSDSVALLIEWFTDKRPESRDLVRVASMLLAKNPQATRGVWNHGEFGFVATVVAASQEQLQITVRPKNGIGGGTGEGGCGDTFGLKPDPGWPAVYVYALAENDYGIDALLVVELDGDRITALRFDRNRAWGQCSIVQSLNPGTRHQLIAYWLGVPAHAMTWQPEEYRTIVWAGKAAYDKDRRKLVQQEMRKLHDTVDGLYRRGLLTKEEATTVRPKFTVTVKCEIDPCPLPPDEY